MTMTSTSLIRQAEHNEREFPLLLAAVRQAISAAESFLPTASQISTTTS